MSERKIVHLRPLFGTSVYAHPTVRLAQQARSALTRAQLSRMAGEPLRPEDQATLDAWSAHCAAERAALPLLQRAALHIRRWLGR